MYINKYILHLNIHPIIYKQQEGGKNMRINPHTCQIISYEDDFCPNCDNEIDWDYPYCEYCGEYVGIVGEIIIEQDMTQEEYNTTLNEVEKEIEEIKQELEDIKKKKKQFKI